MIICFKALKPHSPAGSSISTTWRAAETRGERPGQCLLSQPATTSGGGQKKGEGERGKGKGGIRCSKRTAASDSRASWLSCHYPCVAVRGGVAGSGTARGGTPPFRSLRSLARGHLPCTALNCSTAGHQQATGSRPLSRPRPAACVPPSAANAPTPQPALPPGLAFELLLPSSFLKCKGAQSPAASPRAQRTYLVFDVWVVVGILIRRLIVLPPPRSTHAGQPAAPAFFVAAVSTARVAAGARDTAGKA